VLTAYDLNGFPAFSDRFAIRLSWPSYCFSWWSSFSIPCISYLLSNCKRSRAVCCSQYGSDCVGTTEPAVNDCILGGFASPRNDRQMEKRPQRRSISLLSPQMACSGRVSSSRGDFPDQSHKKLELSVRGNEIWKRWGCWSEWLGAPGKWPLLLDTAVLRCSASLRFATSALICISLSLLLDFNISPFLCLNCV